MFVSILAASFSFLQALNCCTDELIFDSSGKVELFLMSRHLHFGLMCSAHTGQEANLSPAVRWALSFIQAFAFNGTVMNF